MLIRTYIGTRFDMRCHSAKSKSDSLVVSLVIYSNRSCVLLSDVTSMLLPSALLLSAITGVFSSWNPHAFKTNISKLLQTVK